MLKWISTPARVGLFVLVQTIMFAMAGALIFSGSVGEGDVTAASDIATSAGIPETVDPMGQIAPVFPVLAMVLAQGVALSLWRRRMALPLWQGLLTVALVCFVIGTVETQIETMVFISSIDTAFLVRIVILGLVSSLSAAILAVTVFRSDPAAGNLKPPVVPMTLAITLAYVVAYLIFGYYIVWVDGDARAYYHGGELMPFFTHLADLEGRFYLLQIGRGLGFGLVIWGVARTVGASRIALSLIIFALLFGFGCAPLLLPNEFMPSAIRMLHLVETTATAAVLAVVAGLVAGDRSTGRVGLS